MVTKLWKNEQEIVASYSGRCDDREVNLMQATMNFVGYFILLDVSADNDATKLSKANIKVAQVSTAVTAHLYAYRLGNKQPLIDAINEIDSGVLTFMDADAKEYLTNELI